MGTQQRPNDYMYQARRASIGSVKSALVEDEAKELHSLNDQFANYCEKVLSLDALNHALQAELANTEKSVTRSKVVEELVGRKLGEVHKTIEAANRQKADAELQLGVAKKELADMRRRLEDAERSQKQSQSKIDALIGDVEKSSKHNVALQSEMNVLRNQMAKLDEELKLGRKQHYSDFNDLKQMQLDLERATSEKIHLQNQLDKQSEEKDILSRVYEEELADFKEKAKHNWSEEAQKLFHKQLATAIDNVRAEFAKTAEQNAAKLREIEEAKAQRITDRFEADLAKLNDEHRALQGKLSKTQAELAELQKRNGTLEWQLQHALQDAANERLVADREKKENAEKNRMLIEDADRLMAEVQALQNAKRELDAEIGVYRGLLKGDKTGNDLRGVAQNAVENAKKNSWATVKVENGYSPSGSINGYQARPEEVTKVDEIVTTKYETRINGGHRTTAASWAKNFHTRPLIGAYN